MKRAAKKVEEYKARCTRAEEETSALRERAMDLQTEVDKLRKDLESRGTASSSGKSDSSFDTEVIMCCLRDGTRE